MPNPDIPAVPRNPKLNPVVGDSFIKTHTDGTKQYIEILHQKGRKHLRVLFHETSNSYHFIGLFPLEVFREIAYFWEVHYAVEVTYCQCTSKMLEAWQESFDRACKKALAKSFARTTDEASNEQVVTHE